MRITGILRLVGFVSVCLFSLQLDLIAASVHFPALTIVMGGGVGLMLLSSGWTKGWRIFCSLAVLFCTPHPDRGGEEEIGGLKILYRHIYGASALGAAIGLITVLGTLQDPSVIGPAMALVLLSLFWATLLAEGVIRTAWLRLEGVTPNDRIKEALVLAVREENESHLIGWSLATMGILFIFLLLLLSFAKFS